MITCGVISGVSWAIFDLVIVSTQDLWQLVSSYLARKFRENTSGREVILEVPHRLMRRNMWGFQFLLKNRLSNLVVVWEAGTLGVLC